MTKKDEELLDKLKKEAEIIIIKNLTESKFVSGEISRDPLISLSNIEKISDDIFELCYDCTVYLVSNLTSQKEDTQILKFVLEFDRKTDLWTSERYVLDQMIFMMERPKVFNDV